MFNDEMLTFFQVGEQSIDAQYALITIVKKVVIGALFFAVRHEKEINGITTQRNKTVIILRGYDCVNELSIDSFGF